MVIGNIWFLSNVFSPEHTDIYCYITVKLSYKSHLFLKSDLKCTKPQAAFLKLYSYLVLFKLWNYLTFGRPRAKLSIYEGHKGGGAELCIVTTFLIDT